MSQQEDYGLIPKEQATAVAQLLNEIRPVWKGRQLIKRVQNLMQVDMSSACQRLFNAAIHDLKQKIIIMGVDLARQVAVNYKLPSLNSDDDILDYNVSKTIDLAYRIGLLTRPEWRRIHRCYEIRRDLEHEDNEYEAVLEDCFYIFKSAIDIVLSKDPIELLKVTDAKEFVEASSNLVVTEDFLLNYKNTPALRQSEILQMLVSYSHDDAKPDIVRQNSVELLRHLHPITTNNVIIEIAGIIETKHVGKSINLKTAKIAHACGATPYFKKVRLRDFYGSLHEEMVEADGDWDEEGKVVATLEDVGGMLYCPPELYDQILKILVQMYMGQPSYGPWKNYRSVFFSNSAAPIIKRIFKSDAIKINSRLEVLRKDEDIEDAISNNHIFKRFEALVDLVEE